MYTLNRRVGNPSRRMIGVVVGCLVCQIEIFLAKLLAQLFVTIRLGSNKKNWLANWWTQLEQMLLNFNF